MEWQQLIKKIEDWAGGLCTAEMSRIIWTEVWKNINLKTLLNYHEYKG